MQTTSFGSGLGVKNERPGTTNLLGTKGKSYSKAFEGSPDAKGDSTRTPISGARPLWLYSKKISTEDVKRVLNRYD